MKLTKTSQRKSKTLTSSETRRTWLISYDLLPTLLIVAKQTMLRWLQHVITSWSSQTPVTCTQTHHRQMLEASNSPGTSHSLQATSRISSSQTVSCSNRSSEWIFGVKKSNLHRRTDHIPGQISAISQSIFYWGCTQHWPYYLVECNKTKYWIR